MKSAVKAGRNRAIVYWLTTAILALELVVGGAWDVVMLPQVREVIHRVGYPVYFLVILGVWKILGSIAIIIPRFPRLKEWAYAGVVFNLTGALASNLVSGVHDATTVVYLVGMMGITAVSWALRHLLAAHSQLASVRTVVDSWRNIAISLIDRRWPKFFHFFVIKAAKSRRCRLGTPPGCGQLQESLRRRALEGFMPRRFEGRNLRTIQ
jgi:uncharacterized membrane protein YphA (DoxX/SURF4 family)